MSTAYIALGANLPFEGAPPHATLARAVTALVDAGFELRARSGVWRSPAWPPSEQPDYYNAVVAVDTGGHSPQAFYRLLVGIERSFGRERRERWAARTLDLDIVAVDGSVGAFDGIVLPHPRMQERAFVLAPLAEITPDWRHPVLGLTASEMLEAVPNAAAKWVGVLGAD